MSAPHRPVPPPEGQGTPARPPRAEAGRAAVTPAANGPTAKARSRDQTIAGWIRGGSVVLACLVAFGACVATNLGGDDSILVPAPTVTERTDTVALLTKASASQGVCYGWRLRNSYGDDISVGSNLGDGMPIEAAPALCPRWLEVIAKVTYTSQSSESGDSAQVWVASSDGLATTGMVNGLARLGVDADAFVDEPGWSICRAAVFLPLLAAEAGLVEPVPAMTAAPGPGAVPDATAVPAGGSAPTALPDVGSDFWRDRWLYLLGSTALLLITVLLVAIGWFERRHQRRAARGVPVGDPRR